MSVEEAPVGYTNGTSFKWNTRGQTIAAATVLPTLGLIGVGLRFWSRVHRRSGFGLDDVFIFPALVCLLSLRDNKLWRDMRNAHILRMSFVFSF